MSQQLDRSKPLWEMWIVEGLSGGDHFAIVSKVHHCMVDGMSSVDLLAVLLTPEPMQTVEPPPRWLPRPAPTWWQLLQAETRRRLSVPVDTVRGFRGVIAAAADPRSDVRTMLRSVRGMLGSQPAHRLRHAAQPADRTAPARRLVADEPRRREAGEESSRRHLERRRPRNRGRRRAPLPRGPSRQLRPPGFPRDGAGERALRSGARHARQPRLGVDHRPADRRARPAAPPRAHQRRHGEAQADQAGARCRGADAASPNGRRRPCSRSAPA